MGNAQQERGVRIELGVRVAGRAGGATIERELAAGTAAQFRLKVVQVVPNHIEAEAKFMRTMRPGQVVAVRVCFICSE